MKKNYDVISREDYNKNYTLQLSDFSDDELREIIRIAISRFNDKRHKSSQFSHPMTAIKAELDGYFLQRGYTVEDDERLAKLYEEVLGK